MSKQQSLSVLSLLSALFLVGTVLLPTASAQDIVGRISGTLTDKSGAVVPGAKLTLINEATQSRRDLTTDRNGFYAADNLPVGTYTVVAEKPGFKTITQKGNVVHSAGRLTVDLKMEIGTVTDVVEVIAAAETVNTTSGEVATTITQDQVEKLALNQRHYETLIGLVPGAALDASGTNPAALTINYNNSVAETNGQRIDGQNWSVDGGFNLDSGSNNSVFNQVGVDFIQEVTVQTSNYDAEYGRSASSTVNVVTKSGTLHYHGSLFEFVQNNVFNAENAGTKLTQPTATGYGAVPPFHFNDYGWSLGGPVPLIQKKGKLFFFAGQEFKKFRGVYPGLTTASQQQTFPTASEAQGNFTALLGGGFTLKTPALIPASCSGGILYTAPNVINPSCISGDGAAMAALYAQTAKLSAQGGLPNSTGTNNLTFNLANPLNLREDIIRIDEHVSDKHSIYFRYLHDNVQIYNPYSTFPSNPAGIPVDPDLRNRPGYNYQVGWTYVISPTLLNEAKFNADWHKQRTPPQGTAYLTSTYGFKFIPPLGAPTQFPNGLPVITFTSCGALCTAFPSAAPTMVNGPGPDFLVAPTTDINPVDNVTWQKGNHSFKFGGEFARNRKTQNFRPSANAGGVPSYNGTLNFANSAGATSGSNSTGDPFADALLGNFNSFGQSSNDAVGQFRFNDVEGYFQDTWKATSKLSLVLGVRFIYTTPTYTTGNNMTNFNPFTFNVANESTFATVGSGSALNPSSPGLCSGPLTTALGSPVLTIECNGLVLPGKVPASQVKSVPAATADPTLLAAINSTAPRGFFDPEYLFGPRFGFSFSPFDNNKTVLRGGFGIFYDKPEGNLLGLGINSQGYPPWEQQATINGVNASLSQFDTAAGAAVVPAPTTLSLNGVNPNLVVARTYEYSFGIEHELPSDTLVRINYVGNLGRHILRAPQINVPTWTSQGFIPTSVNPNTYACPSGINSGAYGCSGGFANSKINGDQTRPYLGYSGMQLSQSDVNSNYNSLQASLTKRAGFVSGTFAYTYSKVLGDGGGAGDAYNENPEPQCAFTCLVSTAANPVLVNGSTKGVVGGTQTGGVVETWQQFDYGRISFDHTHIVAMAFTLEQPFGRGLQGVAGVLAKGWSLSGIMHYQTGASLTATAASNIGATNISATRRANLVDGQSLQFSGTCPAGKICWVNPNAVAPATTLGAGDAPIGNIIGPDFYQWDMSVRKQFALPQESMKLQFQADAFNVFNHTNWNNPTVNNAGSANFGQITGALPARVLQFGAKFVF